MTLETTVLTVREVKRGETVGYAGAWRAERDSTIAILAAGYGDGLPRHLANGTPVLIGGARYRAGRPRVDGHDRGGCDRRARRWRRATRRSSGARGCRWRKSPRTPDTIPYELLCGVSQRVPLELK